MSELTMGELGQTGIQEQVPTPDLKTEMAEIRNKLEAKNAEVGGKLFTTWGSDPNKSIFLFDTPVTRQSERYQQHQDEVRKLGREPIPEKDYLVVTPEGFKLISVDFVDPGFPEASTIDDAITARRNTGSPQFTDQSAYEVSPRPGVREWLGLHVAAFGNRLNNLFVVPEGLVLDSWIGSVDSSVPRESIPEDKIRTKFIRLDPNPSSEQVASIIELNKERVSKKQAEEATRKAAEEAQKAPPLAQNEIQKMEQARKEEEARQRAAEIAAAQLKTAQTIKNLI